MKNKLLAILILLPLCLSAQTMKATYKEQYRPQFHFSPPANWMNDPNGLLFYNNQYHLFYQSNPFANVWGHMSWSHAVSNDLLHWKHLPVAIKEENGIMIFSGSCVADIHNTSGFAKNGKTPLVAIYTGSTDSLQTQNIAYSNDGGLSWTKYSHNPILDKHEKDFRDPQVFWCEQKKYWVMALVLAAKHKVELYNSINLLNWNLMSEFGPAGDTSAVWECPNLFLVKSKNEPYEKWALTLSVNGAMQYFIGTFNGIEFKNENNPDKIFRPDYGPDYYAAISYNNLPGNKKPIMMGWINNWNYANNIPVTPWKGAFSLPREISIKKYGQDYMLVQQPLPSFKSLRTIILDTQKIVDNHVMPLGINNTQIEIDAELQPSSKSIAGIKLAVGNGHFAEIGYDAVKHVLFMDRSHSANQSFDSNFKKMPHFETPLLLQNKFIKLQIFFDNSVIEVFANDGEKAMTMQVFPGKEENGISIFSKNGQCNFSSLKVYKMKSVWE